MPHLESLLGRLDEFGITRLADISGLDRLGIPVHSCVKPGTTDAIWVYSGKGMTAEQSKTCAIMECLERTAALWDASRVTCCSRDALAEHEVWLPDWFTERHRDQPETEWVIARQLGAGRAVWVPADLVFSGRRPSGPCPASFVVSTTNGLGAGFTVLDAITHALREIIERDVVSCAEMTLHFLGRARLNDLAERLGIGWRCEVPLAAERDDVLDVDPQTLPPTARRLHERFSGAGLEVRIKYLAGDIGVPVFASACHEEVAFNSFLATAGFGAHRDAEMALCGSLLEVAQSRATDLQGSREDCGVDEKSRWESGAESHWLLAPARRQVSFQELAPAAADTAHTVSDLRWYVRRLRSVGLSQIAYVTFPRYAGIYVVRVLVPGIETWHASGGESVPGPRMRDLLGVV